jgi:DNA polymerase III alpha subunit
MAGQQVTVAGLVSYVRHHITKKGDSMAFAQIEDLQGTLELVIFPRVWEQTRDLWEPERILVVRGKVSVRGRDPSILVDSATNEITTARPLDQEGPSPAPTGSVHLHVSIPRSADLEQTIRQLGRLYELLSSYSGEDRFSLYVENGKQSRVQIDFPNNSTRFCTELQQRLTSMVGAGTIRVEPMNQSGGEVQRRY